MLSGVEVCTIYYPSTPLRVTKLSIEPSSGNKYIVPKVIGRGEELLWNFLTEFLYFFFQCFDLFIPGMNVYFMLFFQFVQLLVAVFLG